MKRRLFFRWLIYFAGLCLLAVGIMLNTKTGLGVSAIVSVPYCLSQLVHGNFGNITLLVYCVQALIQYILKGKNFRLYDLLQIPFAAVFTRLLNLLGALLPSVQGVLPRVGFLALAILCTGVGAAMSLDMRLVPNPADGLVQAISDFSGAEMGLCKNIVDISCCALALCMGLLFGGNLACTGVGLGTVASMLGIGRVIAWFNRRFKAGLLRTAGVEG